MVAHGDLFGFKPKTIFPVCCGECFQINFHSRSNHFIRKGEAAFLTGAIGGLISFCISAKGKEKKQMANHFNQLCKTLYKTSP